VVRPPAMPRKGTSSHSRDRSEWRSGLGSGEVLPARRVCRPWPDTPPATWPPAAPRAAAGPNGGRHCPLAICPARIQQDSCSSLHGFAHLGFSRRTHLPYLHGLARPCPYLTVREYPLRIRGPEAKSSRTYRYCERRQRIRRSSSWLSLQSNHRELCCPTSSSILTPP